MLRYVVRVICKVFATEAKDAPSLPTAEMAQQLRDVLLETEDAAHMILNAATEISHAMGISNIAPQTLQHVADQLNIIYASCGFHDLSGQRIRTVLGQLAALDQEGTWVPPQGNALMNGPQSLGAAPSQTEIDTLFSKV